MKKEQLSIMKICTLPLLVSTVVMSGCGAITGKQTTASTAMHEHEQLLMERNNTITSLESSLESERSARYNLESKQTALPTTITKLLPPNAKAGECYARAFIPPTYKTETLTVLRKDASEHIEIIPAKYQMAEERVLIKEASARLEVVPAQYEWVEEQIQVDPTSKRIEEIPAVYKTVSEKILDKPEHTIWKKGSGPITKVNEATGEIMCLVTIPATYKTVTKRVLVSKATTRAIEIPARYKMIKKRIMKTPPTTRTVAIPEEYKIVKTRVLARASTTKHIPIKAEYETITKRYKVANGKVEWRPVLCKTNMNTRVGGALQTALRKAGFNPGPIDGIIGSQTMSATAAYQRDKGLSTGGLTMETLKSLGLKIGNI